MTDEPTTGALIEVALRARVERLTDALQNIKNWADAYPVARFPEPDLGVVAELLTKGGMTLDRVSASIMRQTLRHVGQIAADALVEEKVD